jgi:hypothetical protein
MRYKNCFIYEFDERWCVYKDNKNGTTSFVWKFKTLVEAKKFVDQLKEATENDR